MPKKYKTTVCKQCGKTFTQKGNSTFCSDECREANRVEMYKQIFGTGICEWCGKEYVKKSKNQKCCSQKCTNDVICFAGRIENRVQEKCKIMVIDNIPVFPHLHPKVGSIHDATEYTMPGGVKGCWIDMNGKRIMLRHGEYRRLRE